MKTHDKRDEIESLSEAEIWDEVAYRASVDAVSFGLSPGQILWMRSWWLGKRNAQKASGGLMPAIRGLVRRGRLLRVQVRNCPGKVYYWHAEAGEIPLNYEPITTAP